MMPQSSQSSVASDRAGLDIASSSSLATVHDGDRSSASSLADLRDIDDEDDQPRVVAKPKPTSMDALRERVSSKQDPIELRRLASNVLAEVCHLSHLLRAHAPPALICV